MAPTSAAAPTPPAGVLARLPFNVDDGVIAAKSFLCGATAGVVSKTAVAPIERTKILSQVEFVRTYVLSAAPTPG